MIKSLRNFLIWWLVLHLELRQKKRQEKVLLFFRSFFLLEEDEKLFQLNFCLRFTSEYEQKNTQKTFRYNDWNLNFPHLSWTTFFFIESTALWKLQMRIQTMSGVSVNMQKWKKKSKGRTFVTFGIN